MRYLWSVINPLRISLGKCFIAAVFFFSFSPTTIASPPIGLCLSAVSQTEQYVIDNRQLAAKRLGDNAISSEEHNQLTAKFDDIQNTVTMDNCMSPQNNKVELYQCLDANKGNYDLCRQAL